jgi:endonuclease G
MKILYRGKIVYSLVIYLFFINFSYGQLSNPWLKYSPTSTTGIIINHSYYSLSYSVEKKESEWVFYKLTCEQSKGDINRSNSFRPDPLIKDGSAQLIDYIGSGFDRGHLAPAGDMKSSLEAMSESFYLSNITPQEPSFNRGIWKELEEEVRLWVCEDSLLYIVDGPIFTKNDLTIGPDHVAVPSFFYKIVFYNKRNDYEIIGFILPNGPGAMKLKDYVYKIDDIERLTGLDFFPSLPDSIENRIESHINLKFWHLEN